MESRRRIGDPFRRPTLRDALLPRYVCDHVLNGAGCAARVEDRERGATLSLCNDCYDNRDKLYATADGKLVMIQ